MAVVLALDFGSSFAKAQRFDESGSPVGPSARQPAHIGFDGRADVEAVLRSIEALVDESLATGPEPTAVAISSAWHTLVGVGNDGRATTALSTWMDSNASAEAAELRGAVADPADVHDRVGAPIHPSFPSTRILWIARHEPDAFAATTRWCSLSELVLSRWFATTVGPSSSIASATGMYDQRKRMWDAEVVAAVGVSEEQLAPVDDEPRSGLSAGYRSRWPALADAPWFPAVGDGACAAIGVGADGSRAALTVGTSAAVRMVTDRSRRFAAPLPHALFGYLANADVAVVGAARSNAGAAVDWAAQVFGVDGDDPVAAATTGRMPGEHGLRVDPSIVAERSPRWPLAPSASMDGMRRTTTKLDMLQGFVEGVAIGIADGVDALERWVGAQSLVLSGGAASSPGWRQLLADVLGKPIACSPVSDDSALGAAVTAFEGLGMPISVRRSPQRVVEPDEKRAAAFAEVRAAQADPSFGASLEP